MDYENWKYNAAREAVKPLRGGMVIGLGSGSTVAKVVKVLGELDLDATFVSSSSSTQKLAEKAGLNLTSLNEELRLDVTIDGADEVAPDFSMIKGGGGAHTREKIVANAADEVIIVVDKTKLVKDLGIKRAVPVEVITFAYKYTAIQLRGLGGETEIRKAERDAFYITDNDNYIIDTKFESIKDPVELESIINNIPGVIDNGIFTNLADRIIVGHEKGCTTLNSKRDFMRFITVR